MSIKGVIGYGYGWNRERVVYDELKGEYCKGRGIIKGYIVKRGIVGYRLWIEKGKGVVSEYNGIVDKNKGISRLV